MNFRPQLDCFESRLTPSGVNGDAGPVTPPLPPDFFDPDICYPDNVSVCPPETPPTPPEIFGPPLPPGFVPPAPTIGSTHDLPYGPDGLPNNPIIVDPVIID